MSNRVSHNVSDLSGERFAMLTVQSRAENTGSGKSRWNCVCDCGGRAIVIATNLRNGNTESCGCSRVRALRKTTVERELTREFLQFSSDYIADKSIPEPNSGCWLWLGPMGKNGYGTVRLGKMATSAQSASYIAHFGAVPSGLEVDHLCRNPICVNPHHLEAVTHRENCRRRSAMILKCSNGHLYDYVDVRGSRRCHNCDANNSLRYRARAALASIKE